LIIHTRSILYSGFLFFLFIASNAMSFTIDSIGVNSTFIIRSQLQSIADEIVDSAKFDVNGRIAVLVEGEGLRTLTENAFIEALQKRKYVSVVIDTASMNQILHVYVFDTEIKVRELSAKFSERDIRTTLEARMVRGPGRELRMLGTFHRETGDTAQVFTAGTLQMVQNNNETGLLQRMLTPFVIIGGAIVIVYLFFTVRS
jgi:hypothetical protein